MKQQIIAIIKKEGFIKNINKSGISLTWNFLSPEKEFEFHIEHKEDTITVPCSNRFGFELQELFMNYNRMLIMSDSDIVNFKNNLITLINNYLK